MKLRERQARVDDIERLIAQTDATVERVMANAAKIGTKAPGRHRAVLPPVAY
jgi:hypothetical protein